MTKIIDVKILEVSLVSHPVNPATVIPDLRENNISYYGIITQYINGGYRYEED